MPDAQLPGQHEQPLFQCFPSIQRLQKIAGCPKQILQIGRHNSAEQVITCGEISIKRVIADAYSCGNPVERSEHPLFLKCTAGCCQDSLTVAQCINAHRLGMPICTSAE